MTQTSFALRRSNSTNISDDAPLRYFLPGGKIGLTNRCDYLRTLAGTAFWLGAPPQLGRLLARMGRQQHLHHLQRWWAAGICRHLAIALDLDGLHFIDPHEQYVVAPLHEGFADALALLQLPLRMRFVVRDELLDWRFLGPLLRETGQIAICPEQGRRGYRRILRAAQAVFAAGESLVIFPQGAILGIEIDFSRGAFALARALNRPILPIVLTGSHRVWEYPYTPRLRYGQPMSLRVLPPLPAATLHEHGIDNVRRDLQRRLKTSALSSGMAAPRRFVPARDGYWDGYAYRIDPDFAELAAEVAARRR